MEKSELKPIIESLIFVSEEPMTLDIMAMVFEEVGVKKKEIQEVIEELRRDYNDDAECGIEIREVANGYQFRTKPVLAEWIKRLNVPKPVRLSQPAMETLAIIAYRQPVMRSDIEDIRGVDSGGVLKTLLERGLIRIVSKSDEPGNPLVYGTTKEFLEMFTINSLRELPTLKEIESLEIQERVGDLAKEAPDEEIARGVNEVVEEYRDGVLEVGVDPEKEAEDARAIDELENSIKHLRKMEKIIFPKPKEEITIVPKEGAEGVVQPGSTELSEENTNTDETTP